MFSDYEIRLLSIKPKYLNDEEKKHRKKCIRRIEYQKIKQQIKKDRKENKKVKAKASLPNS